MLQNLKAPPADMGQASGDQVHSTESQLSSKLGALKVLLDELDKPSCSDAGHPQALLEHLYRF